MPTQRGNRYYVQRTFSGVGKIYKSLHTDRKGIARRREEALLALHRHGHHDILRAFADGEVSIHQIDHAHQTSSVPELEADLRRADAQLDKAIRAALRDKSPDVANTTLERYATALDHYRTFCGEGASVREALTEDRIQDFKSYRLEEDGVAKETVNNDLAGISILCTYAKRQGWIDERPTIKKYKSKVRISYLEAATLTAYFAELRPAFRPLMKLLVGTGMRLGEAEALTPADLRLGDGEARAVIKDAKTSEGVRDVFVPEWVIEALKAHIDRQERARGERIFQIPRRTVQKEHNRARERIGRPEYTIHDHRHTAAVHLARAGMPLQLIKKQLGHTRIEQTMQYASYHPDYNDVAPYFERVEARLGVTSMEATKANSNSDNTPAEEDGEEATRQVA